MQSGSSIQILLNLVVIIQSADWLKFTDLEKKVYFDQSYSRIMHYLIQFSLLNFGWRFIDKLSAKAFFVPKNYKIAPRFLIVFNFL